MRLAEQRFVASSEVLWAGTVWSLSWCGCNLVVSVSLFFNLSSRNFDSIAGIDCVPNLSNTEVWWKSSVITIRRLDSLLFSTDCRDTWLTLLSRAWIFFRGCALLAARLVTFWFLSSSNGPDGRTGVLRTILLDCIDDTCGRFVGTCVWFGLGNLAALVFLSFSSSSGPDGRSGVLRIRCTLFKE